MMKEEFEKRLGYEIDLTTYERIEVLYMERNDADKDAFVRWCKRNNVVGKIQNDVIAEMSKRIRSTEYYLQRRKAEADKTHHSYGDLDGEKRKDYEAARDLLVERSRAYYAYNNYMMSLSESVTCSYALECLLGKDE